MIFGVLANLKNGQTKMSHVSKRLHPIHFGMVVIVLMWGLVFVGVKKVLEEMDVIQLVVIRFWIMALIFNVIALSRRSTRPRFSRFDVKTLVFAGILAVPLSQLPVVNGQRFLSPPLASLLMTTSPAWTALLAVFFLGERFRKLQVGGFIVALAGAAVVVLTGTGHDNFVIHNPWGAALTLISPLAWAGFTVVSKPFSVRANPITTLAVSITFGVIALAPLYPHAMEGITSYKLSTWYWLLYLVVGGSVIPYIVWFYALRVLPASKTVAYMYAIPLAALVWSWAILGIVPAVASLLGGLLILVGVVIVQMSKPATIA